MFAKRHRHLARKSTRSTRATHSTEGRPGLFAAGIVAAGIGLLLPLSILFTDVAAMTTVADLSANSLSIVVRSVLGFVLIATGFGCMAAGSPDPDSHEEPATWSDGRIDGTGRHMA